MWHRAADMRFLTFGSAVIIACVIAVSAATLPLINGMLRGSADCRVTPDGSSVTLPISTKPDTQFHVYPAEGETPLMGRFERHTNGVTFHPSLPFVRGQTYRFEWEEAGAKIHQLDFRVAAPDAQPPTVSMQPSGVPFPANALKFYLHFSEPMEQGVVLERLHLVGENGEEIAGPFRETELWSPDGKRLTVWFHPGRQKQGVNLNLEEGPVLQPHHAYTLVIDGTWRSTTGTPIGDDVTFPLSSTDVDHASPQVNEVQVVGPPAGTRDPLIVRFSEPMDSGMLPNAIRLSPECEGSPSVAQAGREWHFTPSEPWKPWLVHVEIDPLLEDLAGNSFTAPFEVDVTSSTSLPSPTEPVGMRWSIKLSP